MAKRERSNRPPAPPVDRREHPRGELQVVVEYRIESVDEFLKGSSTDISLGGIFLKTDAPKPIGTTIRLTVVGEGGARKIDAVGRVVRVYPPGSSSPTGMGIQFIQVDPEGRRFIEEIVRKGGRGR